MGIKSGVVPKIHRWAKARNAGNMDRREFFKAINQIKTEVKAQADLLSVGAEMETRREAARLGLKTNKKLVDIITDTRNKSEVLASRVHKRNLREEARKLSNKGHKAVNKAHMTMTNELEGLDYWESPRSPWDKKMYDNWISRYKRQQKKNPMTQKEKAIDTIEMNDRMWGDRGKDELISNIEDALYKKLGITNKHLTAINELKILAREGTEGRFDPVLQRWFDARRKLAKITKQGTTQLSHYTLKGNKRWAPPEGINVKPVAEKVKEVVDEVEKYGENKIKSIWSGLAEEFKKGYHGIEEIPIKKKK